MFFSIGLCFPFFLIGQNLLDGKFEERQLIKDDDFNGIAIEGTKELLTRWRTPTQGQPTLVNTPEGKALKVKLKKQFFEGEESRYIYEYIQADFEEPLEKDVLYFFSIDMKAAHESGVGHQDIEVFFGTKEIPKRIPATFRMPCKHQLKSSNWLAPYNQFDYFNKWYTIEKSYKAKGEEKYLIFGIFTSNNNYKEMGSVNISGDDFSKKNPINSTQLFRNIKLAKVQSKNNLDSKIIDDENLHTEERLELPVNLQAVYFERGSFQLSQQSLKILNQLKNYMNTNPSLNLEIIGHTDNTGNNENNLVLSERRAKAVVDYLEQQGIAQNRLRMLGKGSSVPVSSNNSENERQKNRRVSFRIL